MVNRLINESDEKIILEPGEALDVKWEKETSRTTANRIHRYKIYSVNRK